MKKNANILIILIIILLLLVFLYLYNKDTEPFEEDSADYHFGILNIKKSLFPSYPRNEEGLIHTSLNFDYYYQNYGSEFQEVIANIFKLNLEKYKDNKIIIVNKKLMDYLNEQLNNTVISIAGIIYKFNEDIKLSNTNEILKGLLLCKFAYIYYNNSTDYVAINYKNNTLSEDGKSIVTDNYDAKYSKLKSFHYVLSKKYDELVSYKGGYGCGNKYINGFNSINYENKNGGDYLSILIVIKNKKENDIFEYLEEIKNTYNTKDNININFTYGNIKDTNTYKTDIIEQLNLTVLKWTNYTDNKPILIKIPEYAIDKNINKDIYRELHIDNSKSTVITTTTQPTTTTTQPTTTTTQPTTTTTNPDIIKINDIKPITELPDVNESFTTINTYIKKIDSNNLYMNNNTSKESLSLIADGHFL
jgi:hypothetical protein